MSISTSSIKKEGGRTTKILLDVTVDSINMYTRLIEYLNNPQLSDGKEPVKHYYWQWYNTAAGVDKKKMKKYPLLLATEGVQFAIFVTIKDMVIDVDEEQYQRLMKMFEQWHNHLKYTIKSLNYRDRDDAEDGGEIIDMEPINTELPRLTSWSPNK